MSLKRLQDLFALDSIKHTLCKGSAWVTISGGIIRSFAHTNSLDVTVDSMNGKSLASPNDTNGGRSWMGHFHVEGLGEGSSWVSYKGDHGLFDSLVSRPCLHDGWIVYTVNNHFFDSGFLESFLILKVSRNLRCRSRGGESTGKTDNDDVLSRAVLGYVDRFNVRESLHNLN